MTEVDERVTKIQQLVLDFLRLGLESLYLTKYIERMGTGTEDMIRRCKAVGLAEPEFTVSDGFRAIVRKSGATAVNIPSFPGETTQETTQERILMLLRVQPTMTRKELAEHIGITSDGIKYHLDKMRTSGRIKHVGLTKKGYWEIIEDDTR